MNQTAIDPLNAVLDQLRAGSGVQKSSIGMDTLMGVYNSQTGHFDNPYTGLQKFGVAVIDECIAALTAQLTPAEVQAATDIIKNHFGTELWEPSSP